MERFFWRYTERNPAHFLLVAEFDVPIAEQPLRDALLAIQRRHVLLSAHVEDHPDTRLGFYRTDSVPPINVTVHHGFAHDWQAIAADELARPFDRPTAPLMRVALIDEGGSSTLVLTFDHVIADGISSVLVLRDLLAAMDGRTLSALPLPAAQEDLIARAVPAPPTVQASPDDDRRMSVPTSVRPFDPTPPHLDRIELTPDATTNLVNRCRREQTTVHAAVVTAASRVRAMAYGEDFVRTFSPINIRESVGQGPNCGLCIGSALTGVSPAVGFWGSARDVSGRLNVARSGASLRAGAAIAEMLLPIDAGRAVAENFFCTKLPYEMLITNLGVQDLPGDGLFRPRALWGPIVLGQVDRELVIGVITYDQQLRMVACGHAPTVGFLHYVRETLEQASR
jgi:hypothetical protein